MLAEENVVAFIVPEALIVPEAVMLVPVKFVILADGADKNWSAVSICPSIVEPDILPEAVIWVEVFTFPVILIPVFVVSNFLLPL